jgi:hypothetical protein
MSDLDDEWYAGDVRDCQEGPVMARLYGSLNADDHERAVRWLEAGEGAAGGMRQWCAANEHGTRVLHLVTGDGWVAVVVGQDDAETAADLLGGTSSDEPLPSEADADEPLRCLPQAAWEP